MKALDYVRKLLRLSLWGDAATASGIDGHVDGDQDADGNKDDHRSLRESVIVFIRNMRNRILPPAIPLRYFEAVLAVEMDALNRRRKIKGGEAVGLPQIMPVSLDNPAFWRGHPDERRLPDPGLVFSGHSIREGALPEADPLRVLHLKTRPQPIPCLANGLALSGGGIRSAAVCLGALQALGAHNRITPLDYMSSVSGGGYTACSLSAAMTIAPRCFPFGTDVSDNDALAHLRNYSNYLMPRNRSGARNASEAAAILLRGFAGNAVIVLFGLLFAAILTVRAYARADGLPVPRVSFIPGLIDSLLPDDRTIVPITGDGAFGLTLRLCWALLATLIIWAVLRRSRSTGGWVGDTSGRFLRVSTGLIMAIVASAILDLQPFAAQGLNYLVHLPRVEGHTTSLKTLLAGLAAFATGVSTFGSRLGKFLEASGRLSGPTIMMRRLATQILLFVAALIVPLLLWASYLALVAAALNDWQIPPWLDHHPISWIAARIEGLLGPSAVAPMFRPLRQMVQHFPVLVPTAHGTLYAWVCTATLLIVLWLRANSYSLHRFYRDRLSKAFLFKLRSGAAGSSADDPLYLDAIKLSHLQRGIGPYPLINAALNVQGSREANQRGRNADFFTFTPHHVGSDLTLYAQTIAGPHGKPSFEALVPDLDLATAMAISGAAVSANMGGSTVRLLSPTLALLNIRLGYWLDNPRFRARRETVSKRLRAIGDIFSTFFLPAEMLNMLTETSRQIYLTDGGHIENLGVYELLKRGCSLIIVIDAEADPTLSFGSLLRVERYARIDLGVRIILPWEEITRGNARAAKAIAAGEPCDAHGPHCAVGKIIYENGEEGMIVYFKSSLSGDEKDYVRDYKVRNPSFPHESTGDQFFTEEQFEMYRSLGFHMVDGFFQADDLAFIHGPNGYANRDEIRTIFDQLCPAVP